MTDPGIKLWVNSKPDFITASEHENLADILISIAMQGATVLLLIPRWTILLERKKGSIVTTQKRGNE